MTITITWPLALLIIASIVIIGFAIKEDEESRGMMQGCMTAIALAFVAFMWVLYGGIYWW